MILQVGVDFLSTLPRVIKLTYPTWGSSENNGHKSAGRTVGDVFFVYFHNQTNGFLGGLDWCFGILRRDEVTIPFSPGDPCGIQTTGTHCYYVPMVDCKTSHLH